MLKILYFGVLLAWCNTCFAQDTHTDSPELPEVFNSDAPDQIEVFGRSNFSPKFLDDFPLEQHPGARDALLKDVTVQAQARIDEQYHLGTVIGVLDRGGAQFYGFGARSAMIDCPMETPFLK